MRGNSPFSFHIPNWWIYFIYYLVNERFWTSRNQHLLPRGFFNKLKFSLEVELRHNEAFLRSCVSSLSFSLTFKNLYSEFIVLSLSAEDNKVLSLRSVHMTQSTWRCDWCDREEEEEVEGDGMAGTATRLNLLFLWGPEMGDVTLVPHCIRQNKLHSTYKL